MARKRNKSAAVSSPGQGQNRPRSTLGDAAHEVGMRAAQAAAEQLRRGDVRRAVLTVEQGLRHAPADPDLLHLGGQCALWLGDVDKGKDLIRRAIKLAPKTAVYHYNLGNALFAEQDLDGALKCFRQAVRLEPKFAEAYTNLGIVFVKKQLHDEAAAAFDQAARLQPDNPQLQLNLAICNMELRRPDKVVTAVGRVESLVGQPDAKLLHEIGNIYRGLGRHLVAEGYYRQALELTPNAPEVWFALGDVLSQAGEYENALEALEQAMQKGYTASPVKLAIARAESARGDIAKATSLLHQAFEAAGDQIPYLTAIAHQYTLIGDFAAQEQCLNRVLKMDPDNVAAFAGLAFAPGRKLTGQEAGRLRQLVNDRSVDAATRTRIGFALGNYYRYAKQYDESFRYYRLGNRQKGYSFDRHAFARWLNTVESLFSRDFFAARAAWGNASRMPVLIVGMPRSGTTLTEQILSSHPAIFGAGEYGPVSGLCAVADLPVPDFRVNPESAAQLTAASVERHAASYLAKMQALAAARGESFVTNKLPHNFLQLGLFGMLFPRAPVIHIKRDPRDNLLSIYFQDFAGFHDYAYDLKSLGVYYRLYERLMRHWAEVIPNPVYELQYEGLIADLPGKSRELAEFVGVDFDERMLRFYEQERTVETASKWQVRQPVYTSSVARWRPYERHLKPLFDALGPDEH